MTLDLLNAVSRFKNTDDRESKTAFFRTRVPWIAPQAYLNVIFKPLAGDSIRDTAQRLRLPKNFCALLELQNGAVLFSGALSIYGIHPPGQLIDRSDPFLQLPFDIEVENRNRPTSDPDRCLVIGSCGFGRASVCLDRRDLHVELLLRDESPFGSRPIVSWNNVDQWIRSELMRLDVLFDDSGKLLVPESGTLPPRQTI